MKLRGGKFYKLKGVNESNYLEMALADQWSESGSCLSWIFFYKL